jgi:alpha-galactosidase
MGWNPWNTYDCNISEAIVLDAAENLVALGLRDAGYDHVNSMSIISFIHRGDQA